MGTGHNLSLFQQNIAPDKPVIIMPVLSEVGTTSPL